MFDVLYHILVCPLICLVFHFVFHHKYDKKHIHVDYDDLVNKVIDKLNKIEEEKVHICGNKCRNR